MLSILMTIVISLISQPLLATGYDKTDGTMDFICEQDSSDQETTAIGSYNYFKFNMFIKQGAKIDIFSDDEFATGNGDVVYDISITQFPFKGAEIPAQEMPLKSCQKAPVTTTTLQDNDMTFVNISFECDGDGDGGYGQLMLKQEDMFDFTITGEITFPEGSSNLFLPFKEETKIKLNCSPDFGA